MSRREFAKFYNESRIELLKFQNLIIQNIIDFFRTYFLEIQKYHRRKKNDVPQL